jgi:hypothetical protein
MNNIIFTIYFGLQINNHLNWKNRNDQIIPKLSGAYYAVRSVVHISNITTLTSAYFLYFPSVINSEIFLGMIRPTLDRYLLYELKLLEL